MNQHAILFVCTVLAAASLLVPRCESYDCSYLDWTESNQEYTRQTRDALVDIDIESEDPIKIWLKLSRILDTSTTISDHYRDVYQDLIDLADPGMPLESHVIERVLEISSILHDSSDESLNKFALYLTAFGEKKFGDFSLEVVDEFEMMPKKSRRAKKMLDKFFKDALGVDEENFDDNLEALKSLDFASSQFDINGGIEGLLQQKTSSEEGAAKIFFNFMNKACEDLMSDIKDAMLIIALADAFGYSSRTDSKKVLKLKEYSRLCLSLRRPDKKERVKSNLQNLIQK